MNKTVFLPALLSLFFLIAPPASQGAEHMEGIAVIHKPFTLYPGKKGDPYTLFYPIEVKQPGRIVVYIKTHRLDPRPKSRKSQPLRATLVDIRAFNISTPQWKKWVHKVNQYNPAEWIAGDAIRAFFDSVLRFLGKKKKRPDYFHKQAKVGNPYQLGHLIYAVDTPELQKTGGRYILMLSNSSSMTAQGNIFIRYPGDRWEYDSEVEKFADKKPDLVIKDVSLNPQHQLQITVRNQGQAPVRVGQYHQPGPEMITLLAKVDGRNYGVTLPVFDPEQMLRKPGRSITYTFKKVVLDKPAEVTVTIDANNMLYEANENNNTLTTELGGIKTAVGTATLQPVTLPEVRPDLNISNISLNDRNEIILTIRNSGSAGLNPQLWTGMQHAPILLLKLNGHHWMTVSLLGYDPQKKLAQAASRVRFNTGLVLQQDMTVTATIDASNQVQEANENNNRRIQILHY